MEFYYDMGCGAVGGPLDVASMRAAIRAGRLSRDVLVTPNHERGNPYPWLPFSSLGESPKRDFERAAKEHQDSGQEAPRPPDTARLLRNEDAVQSHAPKNSPGHIPRIMQFLGVWAMIGAFLGPMFVFDQFGVGVALAVFAGGFVQAVTLLCLGAILAEIRMR